MEAGGSLTTSGQVCHGNDSEPGLELLLPDGET